MTNKKYNTDSGGIAYFLKVHKDAIIPERKTEEAVGYDLYTIEDFIIYRGETKLVRTGLVSSPPIGYYWEIHIRSSIAYKYPGLTLANNVGIIDPDYSGVSDEIKILLRCNLIQSRIAGEPYRFKKGTRLAQLILREALLPTTKELSLKEYKSYFSKKSRGGFGSTD